MNYRITFISDTHTLHNKITEDLPGGDIIICSGDITSRGFVEEAKYFFEWFHKLKNYDHKIFIAGNHDFCFEEHLEEMNKILQDYYNIDYLYDSGITINDEIKIYGTPWQPEFYNWAFNLPRNGEQLKQVWNKIPENTDILITHGPPYKYLDVIKGLNVGCELLRERVDLIKPKINVFGHIHFSHGYYYNGHTHFINASSLNEQYRYANLPITIDWNHITNEIYFYND